MSTTGIQELQNKSSFESSRGSKVHMIEVNEINPFSIEPSSQIVHSNLLTDSAICGVFILAV